MIYKYYSDTSKYAVCNFCKDQICFSHVDQFNDELEFNAKFSEDLCTRQMVGTGADLSNEQIDLQKFKIRICCFCENPYLDNMWKKYANNSKGFCLGYNRNELEKLSDSLILKEVSYTDEIPELCEEKNPKELVLSQIMHKNKCWSEEREIRACYFINDGDINKLSLEYRNLIFKEDDYVFKDMVKIVCPALPLDTPQENRIPSIWYAPKNILVSIKPTVLIIGSKCPDNIKNHLILIAKEKGIIVKEQGDIIE